MNRTHKRAIRLLRTLRRVYVIRWQTHLNQWAAIHVNSQTVLYDLKLEWILAEALFKMYGKAAYDRQIARIKHRMHRPRELLSTRIRLEEMLMSRKREKQAAEIEAYRTQIQE